MGKEDVLTFRVAPHIVQDLGFNLYSNLSRVLVEYVANAYDAESPTVNISFPREEIEKARDELKTQWRSKKDRGPFADAPLEEQTLPASVKIIIEDAGHGMTLDEVKDRFLIAGRRRRDHESKNGKSKNGLRFIMGRKGLGKLAGFGVAQQITVLTQADGEEHATEITLDYAALSRSRTTDEVPVEHRTISEPGLPHGRGTRVVLSKLYYEPMKSRLSTVANAIADDFVIIDPREFAVTLNRELITPTPRTYVWAWPKPEVPLQEFVDYTYPVDDGREFTFKYRLRFTGEGEALHGQDRGIRVYAHGRLASAPSLLDADTNMHGFRMTDYLDGVVVADFIDEQPADYIATDRHSLRWESPLLLEMKEHLTREITNACKERQKVRDAEKERDVEKDAFTRNLIEAAGMSKRERKVAYKIAAAISSLHKKGFSDDSYKEQFGAVIKGLGQGEIISTLASLAKQHRPDLDRVIAEITRLTADELDGFYQYVRGRISGIEALRKLVLSADFKKPDNEDQLHSLLNNCPWLIDPTFFEFLTSNRSEKTMFKKLELVLKVGASTPPEYDKTKDVEKKVGGRNLRPDLVFLLGNQSLSRIVIVELKAPNTPLHGEHYRQLQGYIRDTKKWLKQQAIEARVEGILIGSLANIDSRADEVEWLNDQIAKKSDPEVSVYSIDRLLERAENVHKELLEAKRAANAEMEVS